jgi:hypothetical protein
MAQTLGRLLSPRSVPVPEKRYARLSGQFFDLLIYTSLIRLFVHQYAAVSHWLPNETDGSQYPRASRRVHHPMVFISFKIAFQHGTGPTVGASAAAKHHSHHLSGKELIPA